MNKIILLVLLSFCLKILISCDHEKQGNSPTLQSADDLSYAVADKGRLWNRKSRNPQEITLNILITGGSEINQKLVEEFANEWTEYANLKFVFHTDPAAVKTFDISVIIYEVPNGQGKAGTSYIGTDSRIVTTQGNPSLKLWFTSDTNAASKKGYVLHEFGHAIGLNHEHQHPDREFQFDEEKILAYCKTQNWSEQECRESKINTFSRIDYMLFPYDDKSIMHYGLHKANLTGVISEEALNHANHLSLLDKLAIAKIYPGRTTEEKITFKHNQEELETALTLDYEDCDIVEYDRNGQIEFYEKPKDKSIYEIGMFYTFKDKRDVILNMKHNPTCNIQEEEEEVSSFDETFREFEIIRGSDDF